MTAVTHLFPSVWQRLENLKAWRALMPDDGPRAAFLDARIRELTIAANETGPEFGKQYPALESWRVQVLADPFVRTPLEVAAALELTALLCDAYGDTRGAEYARQRARLKLIGKEIGNES